MKLKLILQCPIDDKMVGIINLIIIRLGHDSVYRLWQSIQHLDIFFDEDHLIASYDEKSKAIDFRDSDGTVIFYVIE